MTGKTPANVLNLFDHMPASPRHADTNAVGSQPGGSLSKPLDQRFTSWISSMVVATGVAGGMTTLAGGAEAFLEMFGPINS